MDLIKEINSLKKEKNAIILTHCYQNIEIDEISDFVGDSLYLSKMASTTNADIIVFAGVYFMAQSAKILSPDKKVLLPDPTSGCLMADMINVEKLKTFKSDHPNIPVVCYINSTAEIKALSDVCCTSSNALRVVKNLSARRVLFIPDTYLGKYVESKLGNVEVITYNGFCPTHLRIKIEDIKRARILHPNSKILAHPECHHDVLEMADFVGSTSEIMEYAKKSDNKSFVIATEKGVVDRLNRDSAINNWGKEFILINDNIICPNMKKNNLQNIYDTLLNEKNEITLNPDICQKARACIDRMFQITSSEVGSL